jgi:hypothetical protein
MGELVFRKVPIAGIKWLLAAKKIITTNEKSAGSFDPALLLRDGSILFIPFLLMLSPVHPALLL